MRGWQRGEWFDSTGLPWVDPSPNIRNLNQALLYPGVAMLEYSTNYSVGRGTDSPFETVGADFIDGRQLAAYLDGRAVPGVRAYPVQMKPAASHFAGKTIEGVRFVITDRDKFDSSRLGAELMAALRKLYPGKIDLEVNRKLIGSASFARSVAAGADPVLSLEGEASALDRFKALREKYLLY